MKPIVARIRRGGGKTLNYLSAVIFALALAAASPSQAADWTVDGVDYTALKAIKGNASGYVVTDITPTSTDVVKMRFKLAATSGKSTFFCARSGSSDMFSCMRTVASKKCTIRIDRKNKNGYVNATYDTSTEYLLDANFDTKEVRLNGNASTVSDWTTDSYTVGSVLYFFALHSNGTLTADYYGNDYLYYFELYDSTGKLKCCLLPAQCASGENEGKYGLFDTKTGTFYPQSGGTAFVTANQTVRTVTAPSGCKKWIGRGADNKMSTAANWEGGLPQAGDDLDFTLAPPLAEINADISGVTFGKLWLDDGDIPTFTGSMTVSDCNDRTKVAGNTSVVFPAGNYTWNGGAVEDWGAASAWTFDNASATWEDDNNAIFSTADATATLAADVTANSLVFNANATISGSSTLTVPTVSVAPGVAATISAPTVGALEKTGAGTLTLSQNRSDATTLTAGTLKMDGATVSGLTLGTDGGPAVIFDYGGQTLSADPSTYLVTGSEVTLTNGTFSSSGSFQIRDNTQIPSVLTIAKDASLVPDNGGLYILKDNGTATINVAGGTLGNATTGSTLSYLQHGSDNGRLEINVTDGGLWAYPAGLYALCNGTTGTNPSLYMMIKDSAFSVNGTFYFGNTKTRPTSATSVFAATNSVVSIASAFYIGRNTNDNRAGSLTADFENCIVTARYFTVYHDRPLNSARFNNTTFVFGADDGSFATSDGADNWITVGADGMTIDTQSFACILNANLGGSGAITKVGEGTLTIASNQTATAALNVNEGALAVNGGVSIARPTTVASGATLTVNVTDTASIDTLVLEAGSALDIAGYVGGVTPLVATSATLPAEGTVNLTLNGGAFAEGIYTICSATGLTAADGAKFVPSTGGLAYSWNAEDDVLILTVGNVDPNAWTGLSGDGRMSTPGNWAGNAVPAAGADIDLSGISADTTIIADAGRTFGAVTMGDGVITFTNSFAATSFSDTSKVAVAADSTVTVVGDLVFSGSAREYICHSVAAGGRFVVTGDIRSEKTDDHLYPCSETSNPGVISARGLVNNASNADGFDLTRISVNWEIGENGISGTKRFRVQDYSNVAVMITATTNFTVSADIIQYRSLTLDTAGWTVSLGDGTSGGILGGAANGLTTVTGTGRVVINYDVNDLSSAASSRTNAFIVATGATLALNPSANIGFGDVTVQDGGTLEIQSGTTTFGNLTVEENAILSFNFTDRRNAPVLALYDGAEVNAMDPFTVKVSGTVWPLSGEKLLTTCGGFGGIPLTLSAAGNAARWANQDRLSVNADGNIVLDVKPMGTVILFR